MAAQDIVDITNDGNGLDWTVTLASAPLGTLSFTFSDFPGGLNMVPVLSATQLAATQWRVRLRSVPSAQRVPYYLQANDTYAAASHLGEIAAYWLGYGSIQDALMLVEKALYNVLYDHRQALDAALQIRLGKKTFPSGDPIEVAEIIRGQPWAGHDRYPLVSVRVNKQAVDRNLNSGAVDQCPVSGMIYVYEFHQGGGPREHIVQALGMAVYDLLQQTKYRDIPLETGWYLQDSKVEVVETNEIEDTELRLWYAVAEMNWSGRITKGLPV